LAGSVSLSLLALTFAVEVGTALGGPAFQSSVSELAPEAEITLSYLPVSGSSVGLKEAAQRAIKSSAAPSLD